jgi:hypothetical protein
MGILRIHLLRPQIERIHNVLGTPPAEILDKFRKHATHMDFNFTDKKGTGISKMLNHCPSDCVNLIESLLAYDPEERLSARQALRHGYFADLRAKDKQQAKAAAMLPSATTTSDKKKQTSSTGTHSNAVAGSKLVTSTSTKGSSGSTDRGSKSLAAIGKKRAPNDSSSTKSSTTTSVAATTKTLPKSISTLKTPTATTTTTTTTISGSTSSSKVVKSVATMQVGGSGGSGGSKNNTEDQQEEAKAGANDGSSGTQMKRFNTSALDKIGGHEHGDVAVGSQSKSAQSSTNASQTKGAGGQISYGVDLTSRTTTTKNSDSKLVTQGRSGRTNGTTNVGATLPNLTVSNRNSALATQSITSTTSSVLSNAVATAKATQRAKDHSQPGYKVNPQYRQRSNGKGHHQHGGHRHHNGGGGTRHANAHGRHQHQHQASRHHGNGGGGGGSSKAMFPRLNKNGRGRGGSNARRDGDRHGHVKLLPEVGVRRASGGILGGLGAAANRGSGVTGAVGGGGGGGALDGGRRGSGLGRMGRDYMASTNTYDASGSVYDSKSKHNGGGGGGSNAILRANNTSMLSGSRTKGGAGGKYTSPYAQKYLNQHSGNGAPVGMSYAHRSHLIHQ